MADETTQDNGGSSTAVSESQGGQQTQAAVAPQQTGWQMFKTMLFRMAIMYAIMSWLRKPSAPASPENSTGTQHGSPAGNVFAPNTKLDYLFYLSESEHFNEFEDSNSLFWSLQDIVYGDWEGGPNGDASYQFSKAFEPSESVKNNGSLYMHVYVVKAGRSANPNDKGRYSKRMTLYRSLQLNKFKKRKFHDSANLLTGQTSAHPDLVKNNSGKTVEILSHWHPNLTVNIVQDHTPWTKGSVPAPLDDYIEFDEKSGKYKPILYFNNYWNLHSDYSPINDTTRQLTLHLQFYPLSLLRWQMYAAQSMRSKWYTSVLGEDFSESDEEQDSLKTTLVETNPVLLGLTIVISLVHSVFEFLAFKNDIQFWRTRKSLEGLSVRSVFFNVFTSLIVLLYIIDNDTNLMVRISVLVGLAIELWKIPKACDVKVDFEHKWFGVVPRILIKDKATYKESDTKKYDKLAFRYLSWLLFPLLGGYAVYSLLYQEHRGWYSWLLSMLYGFLLTFGFIMMTPQLFINYKLKSVAHLPWRMLTYKALNTFIDDIFAFVIKMPTLYRIGCLRDDVIFFIFLYQRYIYRIDPTRVNEYGTTGEMHERVSQGLSGADRSEEEVAGQQALERANCTTEEKSERDKKQD